MWRQSDIRQLKSTAVVHPHPANAVRAHVARPVGHKCGEWSEFDGREVHTAIVSGHRGWRDVPGFPVDNPRGSGEFDDELEFNRCVEGKDTNTDGASRMAAGVSENLDENIARAVCYARLPREVGS